MKPISFLAAATLASATLASSAHAHINATLGDATGRNGNQKDYPCDGDKGSTVFTYEPGATVEINVAENIPHPGYFRIAFDEDGEDFVEPRSIKPVEASRKCPFDGLDKCGESDFCNNEHVLWDNLAPHSAALFTSYKWKIKLPDIECENCVLQVIQVMEDTVHGAYCPSDIAECRDAPDFVEDNYHRCFDIKLKKGAKNGPGGSKDAVSLPTDKKYVDCSKQVPGEPTQTADAGKDSEPSEADAGEDRGEQTTDESDDDDNGLDAENGNTRVDAGVKKKDAGTTKKDAGKASSDDDKPAAASTDDGCALASSRNGAAWALLALGMLIARRRRRR